MLRSFGIYWVALSVFVAAVPLSPLGAQQEPSVGQIIVEGNRRIETETILSYLLIGEGDRFDEDRMDQTLKSLFATGYFADVVIQRRGSSLLVKVIENPVINRIAFEGNKRLEDINFENEIRLKPRVVYSRIKVQQDVKRILDIYRVNGRFGATAIPKVIQLPQNRVDLIFEIEEGPLTNIRSIRFLGNKNIDDGDLRSVILSKEARWYRFFSSTDTYDPDRLKVDQELLRQHYLSEGYADFRIESSVAELAPNRSAFFITISVNEGKRYKFGDINISSGVRDLDNERLKRLINIDKGDWFDNSLIDEVVKKLGKEVGTLGHAFVKINPRLDKNEKKLMVNLMFDVREGPRVFVERIDITGNVRTVDSVIRREFRLAEGDSFDASKLRSSRQKISDLNYFKKVEMHKKPGSAKDKAVIKVNVEEKSTGSLNFGIGYGSDAGPLLDVTVRERNLLGLGQHLSLATTLAAEKSRVNLSFTEPYFQGREVVAGFDLYHTRSDLQSTRSHDTQRTGFGLRVGFPLNEALHQAWKYGFTISEITDVSATASNLVKQQEGTRQISALTHSLVYDKRDSKIQSTEGYKLTLTNEVAGLGGNVAYLKNILSGSQYHSLSKDWVLRYSGRIGHVLGLDEDVEIPDRFFLGGDTLRGFASAGVGPRDRVTDDSLGGELLYHGSVQLVLPLGLPDEMGIKGRIFSDFGSLTEISPSSTDVFDSASVRASAGVGLGWISPFGPISLDLGFPILKESLDITERFRLNFGTRF